MDPDTWAGLGLDRMDQPEAIALCEKLFAKYLDGNALMSNAAHLARARRPGCSSGGSSAIAGRTRI